MSGQRLAAAHKAAIEFFGVSPFVCSRGGLFLVGRRAFLFVELPRCRLVVPMTPSERRATHLRVSLVAVVVLALAVVVVVVVVDESTSRRVGSGDRV